MSMKMPKKPVVKRMSDPAQVRASGMPEANEHRTGEPCVEFKGHFVQAKQIPGVTRPTASTAGSHDRLVRGDGSELKGCDEDVTEQAWTTSKAKSSHSEFGG
jgi:hypothetical protein